MSFSSLDLEKIKAYIDSFRFGAPPHAGGGIGKCMYFIFYYFFLFIFNLLFILLFIIYFL